MPTIVVKDRAEWNLIQEHMAAAGFLKERLAGPPLTAQEIADGIRLSYEEYIDLVHRAVRDWSARHVTPE